MRLKTAVASVCRPIVVVIGAHAEVVSVELEGLPITVAYNTDWTRGIGSACLHLRVPGCVDRGLRPFIEPLAGLGWGQIAC
jgi:hypothetical protein